MIAIDGLDGSPVLIAPGSICRIRRALAHEAPDATKVEHGGGCLFTREPAADLIARIGAEADLVRFTTRGGAEVYLSRGAVAQVRPGAAQDGGGTEITVAGRHQHVAEDPAKVASMLEQRRSGRLF